MILLGSVIFSLVGFIVLALGMAKYRKSAGLASISASKERLYLVIGLLILAVPLMIDLTTMNTGSAIVWWCGQLSLSALIVVFILSEIKARR